MNRNSFNAVAARYDRIFTDSRIGGLQRRAVHTYLENKVLGPQPLSVLELGCGTGEDAVFFAEREHHVTATDVSTGMLEQTAAKAEERGLSDRIRTLPLDLQAPETAALEGPFDLVFSNFGALNCIDSEGLHHLGRCLEDWISPGGSLVVVVMPRACLWETLYFLGRARPKAAFRRFSAKPVSAPVGGGTVMTWYHGPRSLEVSFGHGFVTADIVPIGLTVPPSFLEPWADRHPRILAALDKTDRRLRSIPLLASIADHALIHLERN